MKIINMLKIDLRRTRPQLMLFLLFIAIGGLLSFTTGDGSFGIVYLCFVAVILSTMPFPVQEKANVGFLNMLPATTRQRVMGRYLYGILLLMVGLVCGIVILIVAKVAQHNQTPYQMLIVCAMLGFSFFTIGVQYTLLYALGNVRSKQVLSFVRMIPGFILFFGAMGIVNGITSGETIDEVGQLLVRNERMIGLSILTAGVITLLIFIEISVKIVKAKDSR